MKYSIYLCDTLRTPTFGPFGHVTCGTKMAAVVF